MLDESTIESYRRMSPEKRWLIVEELMSLAWRSLLELPEQERIRRLKVIREEHELSDALMLDKLRKFS